MLPVKLRLRKRPELRAVTTRVGICLALVLGASLFAASPAMAVSSSGLAHTAGHTCEANPFPNGGVTQVFCVELGIYNNTLTAQIEGICEVGSTLTTCDNIRAVGEVANGGGAHSSGTQTCTSSCVANGRTYFYPLGQFPALSPGACDNNAWALVVQNSEITAGGNSWFPSAFATPHFNVCETSTGGFTFTKV